MINNNLIGVCWFFTSNCNMNCPICYSYKAKNTIPDLNTKKKIINQIHDMGIKKIMFTGGEPTVEHDFFDVLKYSKLKGLKNGISTNGTKLTIDNLGKYQHLIDELTLPLEGSTQKIHAIHRGDKSHFLQVIKLLSIINGFEFKADVSTVLTAFNKADILNVLDILVANDIYKWKIFQYSTVENTPDTVKAFSINNYEFESIINIIKKRIFISNISIDIDYREDNEKIRRSYIFISPCGDILMLINNCYQNIGNIFFTSKIQDLLVRFEFNINRHKERHWRDINI